MSKTVSQTALQGNSCHNFCEKLSLRVPCVKIPAVISTKNCLSELLAFKFLPQFLRNTSSQNPLRANSCHNFLRKTVSQSSLLDSSWVNFCEKLSLGVHCATIPATISAKKLSLRVPCVTIPVTISMKNLVSEVTA